MRKRSVVLSLVAAGALVASGCEPDGGKTAPVGNPSALVGDEAEGIGPPADDSEIRPYPVSVVWTDGAELAPQSSLELQLTYDTTDDEMALVVSVESRSLIGDGGRALGEVVLGPGESAWFALAADELPVLSDVVVSQMAAGLRKADASSNPVGKMHLAAPRFYRHDSTLGTVRAYTEETLASELDGVLYQSDLPTTEMSESALAAETLGYVADASGEPQPVSLADTALVSRDAKGNVDGITSSYSISVGKADHKGPLSFPEEDPTVDGPGEHEEEVADE